MPFYQGFWDTHKLSNHGQSDTSEGTAVEELPGAFFPFLLATLFVTIAVLAQERVFNAFLSSMAFYIIGCCHGLAVGYMVSLVNNGVISITNTTDHTALETYWQFLACYSLCLVLCNAVFNCSRNLPALASTVRRQVRIEGVLKEGVPTDRDIAELALEIIRIWRRLGRALGIQEAIITEIQENEDDVYERALLCLKRWRQMMGDQANFATLAQALERVEIARNDLIQRFCYAVLEEPHGADDNPQDGAAA